MADRVDLHARARAAIEHFWSATSGGHADYAVLQGKLEALKLTDKELERLRAGLPIPETQGTTAAKIARARQCIEEVLAG